MALPGWVLDATEAEWEDNFTQLQQFVATEGHARVPKRYKNRDGGKLGQWVRSQRDTAKKGRLSPQRRARLEALPRWVWDPLPTEWEENFSRLQQVVATEGHARVPQSYMTPNGDKLGYWVGRQRTANEQGSRLLANVSVRAEIVAGKAERHTKSVMSAVEALERASTIGRLDIRQFYHDDRSLKNVSEWTPSMGAQVGRIDTIVINAAAGDGHTDTVHKLGFHDVLKALEFIGRHHGVFAAEKTNVQVTADAEAVKILQAAYTRADPVRRLKE